MSIHDIPHQRFTARGIYVGGIYPFNVEQPINFKLVQERANESKLFCIDFPDRQTFIECRRLMYDPEQRWNDPAQVLFFETTLHKCTISTGRSLEDVPFCAYLSIYASGFITVIFWIGFSKETFQIEEIIELAASARGTTERINPTQKMLIEMEWEQQLLKVHSFIEICKFLEEEFYTTILKSSKMSKSSIQFTHPIVYVQEVVGCLSARDIMDRYAINIAALVDLWVRKTQDLKDEEVERILKSDFHPLGTGVTYVSVGCTAELHPKTSTAVLKEENRTFDEHHYQERVFLSFICEVLVAQYFVLRVYDAKLSSMHINAQNNRLAFLNPLYPFFLMYSAAQLTKTQREFTLSVNEFRYIYLKRRSYYQHAMNLYRETFDTSQVEESIDKKLVALQTHISTTYSMLTTILTLVLSVIATIFGIFGGIQALQSLGWFH